METLLNWVTNKPLVLLRFPVGVEDALIESKHGFRRFTFSRPHEEVQSFKLPTLCLIEMQNTGLPTCFVGVITSSVPVTTFDSRITVVKLQQLNLESFQAIEQTLPEKLFQNLFKQRIEDFDRSSMLSPKLSVAVISALLSDPDNRKAIETATLFIPSLKKRTGNEWEQSDAIKTAIDIFGLKNGDSPVELELSDKSDSAMRYIDSQEAHVLEDNVIARDASILPGFTLLTKYVTGRAIFINGQERLEIYTANRGPLEAMLGVDLIYLNTSLGNSVMVQYKMLDQCVNKATQESDWIFKPDDQLKIEMDRMKLLPMDDQICDYRLNKDPFFFKFVRRKGDGKMHKSFVVSLDHLKAILGDPNSKGPKGGVRISFESLKGLYLRESDLIGLIRSGYIGTHSAETHLLQPIIQAVSEGKRALVLAWQKRLERDSANE